MKTVSRKIDKDSGSVTLRAEDPEDMWHVYNLLLVGDRVKASTYRRVQRESATGSVASERIKITLTLEVVGTEFDATACTLHVRGKNCAESPHVRMGAFHTMDLELNRNFTIYKDEWSSVELGVLENACDVATKADLAVLVMMEGLAHLCLVTSCMTVTRARIEVNIPRKRAGASGHDKAITRFFEQCMSAVLRHIDFDIVKSVVVASPGHLRSQFVEYLMQEAVRREHKAVLQNKGKFILANASSGHKHAVKEVLSSPELAKQLAETSAAGEVRVLHEFQQMFEDDPDRALYGPTVVCKANESLAIQDLLILDSLFRSPDVPTRKKYIALVESVKDNNGNVHIFSSMHVSGEQLEQLTGIAAILRFPMPDLADMEGDEEDDGE